MTEVLCDRVSFMAVEELKEPLRVRAKIRYHHAGEYGRIEKLPEGRIRCIFEKPVRAATPGQAIVFYEGDCVLGGGTILGAQERQSQAQGKCLMHRMTEESKNSRE